MHSQLLDPPHPPTHTHPGSHLTRAHIHTHTPNFATAWRVMREHWHVLPRHLLLCQPRQGQPAGPYMASRAGAKRLSHERTRPPEACGHLWPYHSMNDSHIYGSIPVTWTHATRWHLLLQFLSNTNNRYPITAQSILTSDVRRQRPFTRISSNVLRQTFLLSLLCLLWSSFWWENEKNWEICYVSFW